MPATEPGIARVELIVGLEVHVQLATRTKMFARAGNPAHPDYDGAEPNTLIDPTVLALPGALPVMNRAAVEMAMKVGLALNCSIAPFTKWDRKSYFYPDLPKSYQISQYDLPLCFDGSVQLPASDARGNIDPEGPSRTIGIIRAHLEEDAGKLLHEAPGGHAIDHSIADYNRAGAPLLEIVTQPDFRSADEVVLFARMLRNICRFLGVSEGVMQKGHMRFEPNINCVLHMDDGTTVRTPIVEVKNLNSFKALKGAIDHELAEQPQRYLQDRRVMGAGMKSTRGWDDHRGVTFLQREKEDAHDYRYFPDPDLVPVTVDSAWLACVKESIPELPAARFARYVETFGLGPKEAQALVDERDVCLFYEACIAELVKRGIDHPRAGKLAANSVLQAGLKRANERQTMVNLLGITPAQVAAIAALREQGKLNNQSADELFGLLCEPGASGVDAESLASSRGMIIVRDDAAMERWIDLAIAEQPQAAADVRAGKQQALGRLVGAAMKHAAGQADAKTVREALLKKLG
jgi:aspartyl-tRNA(Asn)/glutamyl-tRNA(Gln) amidotransferase subunit B